MPEKFKVVISGMSGRFPECDDINSFKDKLYNGGEFITTDNRKWPVGFKHKMTAEKMVTDTTGKLLNVHKFDQTVFKMSASWALGYDIINRLSLEPSFEAIVDAGINPYSLDRSNVCVFMTTANNEATHNLSDRNVIKSALTILGTNKNMLSNRISYFLNLTGTSVTNHIDVHGGLESLAMGYKLVSGGFADAAIVGAVSSIVDPRMSLQYATLNILSPDGITRPFDEWANGYGRSEGVVCFYLQRAEDAKRNYGEIKFCDFQYFGSELENFVCYKETYVEKTLRHLFKVNSFNLDSSDIGYVEMNTYGQKFMDKVESNAIAKLLSKDRKDTLMVGSIKSNIGQAEAAAGFMSVLKAIFALDSGIVAPNKHLQKTNREIEAFERNQLQVVIKKTPLPGNQVAVTSLGLCGSVGLAVIEKHKESTQEEQNDRSVPRILLICGRDEQNLWTKLTQIEKLPYNAEFISLANDVFHRNMSAHIYRGFTILPPPLKQPIHDVQMRGDTDRPVWFVFSGMGSQWNGMGRDLLKVPLFAEVVARCDNVLKKKDIDIYNILTSDDPNLFDNILNSFLGIITVQIGLYEVVKAIGIEPNGIIGHSLGENACAYADGCLTLEEAVLASWARGVTFTKFRTIDGLMAVVGKGNAEMREILPAGIQVACHNSKDNCTLSGPAKLMNTFVQKLQADGIFARIISSVNIAPHSKYIASLGPKLLDSLNSHVFVEIEPRPRSSKWISTSIQESEWDTPLAQFCSAEYLTNNLLSEVFFEEGCAHIPDNAICIEFAPHGLLQTILTRSLPTTCTNISLTNRWMMQDNESYLFSAIGRFYIAGLEPQVNKIFPSVEYPVSRGTPSLAPYCAWYQSDDRIPYHLLNHFKEDHPVSNDSIPICIREDSEYFYLKNHKINGDIILPMSFFIHLVWRVFSFKQMEELNTLPICFENVKMHNQVKMSLIDTKYAFIMIQHGSGNFQVNLQDEEESLDFSVILTGRINLIVDHEATQLPKICDPTGKAVPKSHFQNVFERAGYLLEGDFKLVNDLQSLSTEYKSRILWNGNWVTFLDALIKVQMFVDNNRNIENIRPSRLRRLEIWAPQFASLKEGTILLCWTDATTQKLICSGIAMYNVKYESFTTTDVPLNEFRILPHQNSQNQDRDEWGIYQNLTQERKNRYGNFNIASILLENENISAGGPIKIDHIYSLNGNANNNNLPIQNQNLHFSYAASARNGEKRIGLATLSSTRGFKFDQYLFWTPSCHWSFKEATAVPYIYAQAYNLLNPCSYTRRAKTVMINVGAEHSLAEAVIALAHYRNQTVFLTVCNNEEAIYFTKNFPKLNASQILCNKDYGIQLRQQTKGEGVDLVINCLPGNQHVSASLSCVKKFGFLTEVGKDNCRDSFEIGMFDFTRYTTLRIVQNDATDLLKLPIKTKIRIKNFLQECINKGIVIPPQTQRQQTSVPLLRPSRTDVNIPDGNVSREPSNSDNPVIIRQNEEHSCIKVGKKVSGSHLQDYLPQDVETWSQIGQDETGELKFIETSSLSRRYVHCKGVYPIFALPAIHSTILKPLFQRLHYPIFTLTSTPTTLTKEVVLKLYKSLSEVQSSGPVTMISETWTLHLAVELASYLQLQNRKYRIFVLEGNSKNWQDPAVTDSKFPSLEEFKAVITEEKFLDTLYKKYFSSKSYLLENRITSDVDNGLHNTKMAENVFKVLNRIGRQITELANTPLMDKLLCNVTLFERHCPDDEAFKLSITSEVIIVNESDYRNLLTNPTVIKVINEKAEYSWWDYNQP